MDFIKKKGKRTSNVVTVYLKDKDLEALEYLRKMDANVSMVCRKAIREAAQKLMKGDDTSDAQEKLVVKCDGKVTINMENNEFTFENYNTFLSKDEFQID